MAEQDYACIHSSQPSDGLYLGVIVPTSFAWRREMDGLSKALDALFEKLANVFDIFDLSYFISGAVSVSALIY